MTDSLEYNKLILTKVSFNQEIFEKELFKALQSLLPHKRFILIDWCASTYSSIHYKIIRKFVPKKIRSRILKTQKI
ncbi:MAG: hypothetical protein EAZ07_00415 [Cytophagales bacterium]|nr:MAG: hypothetical protein EAZ07_00415 [Cytophagales bacterium]